MPTQTPPEEPCPADRDEAWHMLFEACQERFRAPEYEVECDARHAVWVRRADRRRSFGVQAWSLRKYTLEELLERIESKLDISAATGY
ncbi:MAG: hypothetical protein AB2L09_03850 [Coriobacteriia bacterium]